MKTGYREHVVKKLYYKVGEIASILAITPVMARNYETSFNLKIPRTGKKTNWGRERRYENKHLNEFKCIMYLLREEGYTVKGAIRKFNKLKMNIGELKQWLSTLPPEFNDMSLVYRKYDEIKPEPANGGEKEGDEAGDYYFAMDAPIVSGYIDEDNRECCLLDNPSREFIVKMNNVAENLEKDEEKEKE